ncbi:hypothetical protein, partial [Amantichitinum ursilacus]|uniref:hypothetical protein n=1 Tax=Amantichitinum ursilacus TaxID=857265 RepID=UPI001F4430D5
MPSKIFNKDLLADQGFKDSGEDFCRAGVDGLQGGGYSSVSPLQTHSETAKTKSLAGSKCLVATIFNKIQPMSVSAWERQTSIR